MKEVLVIKTLNAPADEVWATLRSFEGLERYLPTIAASSLEGTGIGAVRISRTWEGTQIVERLESIDDAARALTYSITASPLPVEDYRSILWVRELTGGRCSVMWACTFQPTNGSGKDVEKLLKGTFSAGLEGLERLHGDRR